MTPQVGPSLHDIRDNISGAVSSLAMPPEPLDKPLNDGYYLCDTDVYAHHAEQHLQAAYECLSLVHKRMYKVQLLLGQLAKEHPALSEMLWDIKEYLDITESHSPVEGIKYPDIDVVAKDGHNIATMVEK